MAKALVTFEGWDGQWWKRIKVGRGIYDAAMWVIPFKWSIAIQIGEVIIGEVSKRGTHRRTRKARR